MSVPAFPTISGIKPEGKLTLSGSTVRHEAISGKRTILPQRSIPRRQWELPVDFLRSKTWWRDGTLQEFEALVGFINAAVMGGTCFAYTDPDDNAVTTQGFGQGDGVTTAFQLVRALGGFSEPVYLPTITTIFVAGTPTAAYTLGSTGIVTFTVAPANGAALTWTGTFAWLCRFDVDQTNFDKIMKGWYGMAGLKFSSEISP